LEINQGLFFIEHIDLAEAVAVVIVELVVKFIVV
jgi:hypothetical protein